MKKIGVILVIVCVLSGICSLSASASVFHVGDYVETINAGDPLLASNLRAISSDAFNIPVYAVAKRNIEMNTGITTVNAFNVDVFVTFRSGSSTLTFAKDLTRYFDVMGRISGDTVFITFSEKGANTMDVYRVDAAIDTSTETGDVSAKLSSVSFAEKYILSPASLAASISKWNSSVYSLTIGSRLYAADGEYDMADLAIIRATVHRQNGAESVVAYSETDVITSLLPGETVLLESVLPNKKDNAYYTFNGWVNENGQTVSTSRTLEVTIGEQSISLFATYVPATPHITLSRQELQMTYKQTERLETFPDAVRWESSNPKVARVDAKSGVIEAVGAGNATVTAYSADGACAACEVTVRYTFVQWLILIFLFGWIWY